MLIIFIFLIPDVAIQKTQCVCPAQRGVHSPHSLVPGPDAITVPSVRTENSSKTALQRQTQNVGNAKKVCANTS